MQFIRQRSYLNRTEFVFLSDKLKFTIYDSRGSQTVTAQYSSIQVENKSEITEMNEWFRNAGLFCLLVEIVKTSLWFINEGQMKSSLWLLIGTLSLAIYYLIKTHYTLISSDGGNIYIIRNKKHDEILDEINKRRKKQVLSIYGDINYDNNPKDEITKFAWLKDLGFITEEKLQSAVKKITDYHSNKLDSFEDEEGGKTLN